MSINIGPASNEELRPKITVIGVGGAGGNAIANMIAAEIEGVDFIAANTDAQALSMSAAEKRIQLGPEITGGLGAGARPEVGRAAAEETVGDIEEALDGVNMVFIAAGMGGGTGTGAATVIAEAARRKGVLTVGVVTKPFLFEGSRRMRAAEAGIQELQGHVDTLIVIPNQNLFLVAKPETTFKEAFLLADEVLQQGVRSITDLMVMPGLINLDFADVRSVMSEMGKAMMGTGESEGENRAMEAAEFAIANPLLDGVSMQGAKGVIISIIGGEDMKLLEVDEAANHIRELVDEDANIIWGSAFNPSLDGKIRVSVVATGIEQSAVRPASTDTKPISLGAARPPKRPVLELSSEEAADASRDLDPLNVGDENTFGSEAEAEVAEGTEPAELEEVAAGEEPAVAEEGSFAEEEAVEVEEPRSEPFDLTGMQAFDDVGDEDDDIDGIVDPLAGLRNAEGEYDAGGSGGAFDEAPVDADSTAGFGGSETPEDQPVDEETLDLSADMSEAVAPDGGEASQAEEPAPAESRRSRILGGGGSGGAGGGGDSASGDGAPEPSSGGGSTLFERMASLSRGGGSDESEDEDDDQDGGSSLSIPRFLGRQNNQ